ncbi:MAG TPA: CsbD family protein [Planctomycetota bacterium]|nr:CsbD family protein [Planctomycetota bacterium]
MTGVNKDVIAGKWKQAVGKAKQKWGKLTDDELDRSEGRAEQLAGLVQERYGKARAEAEKEVRTFLKECGCE